MQQQLSNLSVLVVDDDEDLLELLRRSLSVAGAHVITALSVADAKRFFAESRPDVVVSDLVMPDGGGYAFIQHIRELSDSEGRFTPAIALSSATDEGTRRTALRAGFWRFAAKPVDASFLCTEVAVLGRVYKTSSNRPSRS